MKKQSNKPAENRFSSKQEQGENCKNKNMSIKIGKRRINPKLSNTTKH